MRHCNVSVNCPNRNTIVRSWGFAFSTQINFKRSFTDAYLDDDIPIEALETPVAMPPASQTVVPPQPPLHHHLPPHVPTTTTSGGSSARSSSRHRSHSAQPSCSLQHEFSLLNTDIPHIDVEVLDAVKRSATVRISVNGHIIMLQAQFPADYPAADQLPEFAYCQGTTLQAPELCATLMQTMRETAQHRARKRRTCLEQCLRALVAALKKATGSGDRAYQRLQSPRLDGALSGALHDACVPFPRTSGARFSHVGVLVCFAQQLNAKQQSLKLQYQQQQQHQVSHSASNVPRSVCNRFGFVLRLSNTSPITQRAPASSSSPPTQRHVP